MNLKDADELADRAVSLMGRSETEALHSLQDVVRHFPDIDRFQFRLAMAQQQIGHEDAARESFLKAITLNPDYGIFHHRFMESLARLPTTRDATAYYSGLGGHAKLPADLQRHFCLSLLAQGKAPESVYPEFPDMFGRKCRGISAVGDHVVPQGIVEIDMRNDGFRLSARGETFSRWILAERLLHYVPYLDQLAQSASSQGKAWLALDDVPAVLDRPVLAQSGYDPKHILIPDSIFLATNAYEHLRRQIASDWLPVEQRIGKAYWRGALTGLAGDLEGVLNLPRVRLPRLSLNNAQLDAKVTDTSQFDGLYPGLRHQLYVDGLLGERAPEIENVRYQVLIDVDGNSNAWSGLFLKLLAGGAIVKLMTPFRQWYYGNLRENEHYVPIHDLETELDPAVSTLLADEDKIQQMTRATQALVGAMTCDSEFPVFARGFEAALWK